MKLSTFLLLAAVSGAWGQTANTTATTNIFQIEEPPQGINCHLGEKFIDAKGLTWKCAVEAIILPPGMKRWEIDGTALVNPLPIPCPASEGKSDHPEKPTAHGNAGWWSVGDLLGFHVAPLLEATDDNCLSSVGGQYTIAPCTEPMDVPATKRKPFLATRFHKCGVNETSTGGPDSCFENYWVTDDWTCKKGSGRILLEDVDGGHHCVKF
jgi:hypothetical protein